MTTDQGKALVSPASTHRKNVSKKRVKTYMTEQAIRLAIISRSVNYGFFFSFMQLNFLIGKLLLDETKPIGMKRARM